MLGRLFNQTTAAEDSSIDGFPRLGAGRIGNRIHEQEPETSRIASNHFLIFNPQQHRGSTFVAQAAATVENVHAINPDCYIYCYADVQEAGEGGTVGTKCFSESGPTAAITNWAPNPSDWWARDDSGDLLTGFGASRLTNISRQVQPDAFGKRLPKWYAEDYFGPTSLDPHNSAGVKMGVYCDVFGRGPVTGNTDLNGDGVKDDAENNNNAMATAYREGHKDLINALTAKYPGMQCIGNCRTWSGESTSTDPADWGPGGNANWSHYENLLYGGWMEGQTDAIGTFPLSGVYTDGTINPTFGSWRRAQNGYLFIMRWTMNTPGGWPHVLNHYSWETTPTDETNPVVGTHITAASMAVARWGLCSTLLDNGAFGVTNEPQNNFNWTCQMDEMGTVNTATTGLSREWLGQAVDTRQLTQEIALGGSSVWLGTDTHGIFKREFDNGIVLVNSSRTTNLDIPVVVGADEANGEIESGKWKRITGYQDSSFNDGSTITSDLTINKIDGIILERV